MPSATVLTVQAAARCDPEIIPHSDDEMYENRLGYKVLIDGLFRQGYIARRKRRGQRGNPV
jgi:hypothetical protein